MIVPLMCSMFCGNACVTANSRMLYAFSRDGAVPMSRWWRLVNPYFEAPVNAVRGRQSCKLPAYLLMLQVLQWMHSTWNTCASVHHVRFCWVWACCVCVSSAFGELHRAELYAEGCTGGHPSLYTVCVYALQVWCVVLLCFILGMPMLHSYVAFAAITSIGVIGLYISYLGKQLDWCSPGLTIQAPHLSDRARII
jgi:amino acid transporter